MYGALVFMFWLLVILAILIIIGMF